MSNNVSTSEPECFLPTLSEIESAADLIRPHIPPTPCFLWPRLNEIAGCEIWVKHENHTPAGAFKVRGGAVYLHELLQREPGLNGVIAASTGNHGLSIAIAARMHRVHAVIIVPIGNNPEKNAAIKAMGAELREHGEDFQSALEYSRECARQEGLHPVPSFHPWLIRGVATYALEMFRTTTELDAVLVPIGLGSGACGVIAARNALGLATRIVGVVSEEAPAYFRSFQERRLVCEPTRTTVAEGVACRQPNQHALSILIRELDSIVTVTDAAALRTMKSVLVATHNLVEGAAALPFAEVLENRDRWRGRRIACIMSGGNAGLDLLQRALDSPPFDARFQKPDAG